MYHCGICKTNPDQISHHKMHLSTSKHIDKKELFELKLGKLKHEELEKLYGIHDVKIIVNAMETVKEDPEKMKNEEHDEMILDLSIIKDMEENNIISNKEALKDKIHEIHNYLRNNGAGYGMNALKVFNLIYGLKKIEECGLLDKVNLKRPECEFSYLLDIARKDGEHTKLYKIINNIVLESIYNSEIALLIFYDIPKNIKGSTFAYLIKEINKITKIEKKCNVLLSGKIYEYFIGRDESAISELGAYFTDRHIVDYVYNKVKPELNDDNSVRTMIDMFGGSGGFTTGYINYLVNTYPDVIDWEKNIDKIHHYDMNEDVIKSAGLEFFCLTGQFPNMENMKCKNSFKDDFENKKYDYVITNPPYGGDKIKQSTAQFKRDKIKKYIMKELETLSDKHIIKNRKKQLKLIDAMEKQEKEDNKTKKVTIDYSSARIKAFAEKYKLVGNDKESVSLILMMDMLKEGGTCAGVLKEGVFFNRVYKGIRECLIKNFKVREVISVPQDQFENTSTKTSILIFDNSKKKTKEVKFSELIVERYEDDKFEEIDGNIVLTENKGDISGIGDRIVSCASYDELVSNPIFSLNGKDYKKKNETCGKDFKLVKIGDICDFLPKSNRPASFGKQTGKYNFYTSSDTIKKCDVADYTEELIMVGTGGNSCLHISRDFSCSADMLLLKPKKLDINMIYYSLKINWDSVISCMHGSTMNHVTKDAMYNIQIPIPKSEQKLKEWVDKISKPYNEMNEKRQKLQKLEEKIRNKIKKITEEEECDDVELGEICEYIKTGKNKTPDCKSGNLHPYYGTSDITGYTDHWLFDGDNILIARNGTIGNCFLTHGKIYPSDHIFVIKIKENVRTNYVYHFIKECAQTMIEQSNGSTIRGISKSVIEHLKIKLPTNMKLFSKINGEFEEIQQLFDDINTAKKIYKKYIAELSNDAMPKSIVSKDKKEVIEDSDNEIEEEHTKKSNNKVIDESDNKPEKKSKKNTNKKV